MDPKAVRSLLRSLGAFVEGTHVVFTHRRHADTYINKDSIYAHPLEISRLCLALAQRFVDDEIQVVVAPAIGGVVLTQWLAYHLGQLCGREVLAAYAEKEKGGGFIFRRGYGELIREKRVLVAEDIKTTGDSARAVIRAARRLNAKVVGLAVLVDRRGDGFTDEEGSLRFEAFLSLELPDWDEGDCPLCRKGVPINANLGAG